MSIIKAAMASLRGRGDYQSLATSGEEDPELDSPSKQNSIESGIAVPKLHSSNKVSSSMNGISPTTRTNNIDYTSADSLTNFPQRRGSAVQSINVSSEQVDNGQNINSPDNAGRRTLSSDRRYNVMQGHQRSQISSGATWGQDGNICGKRKRNTLPGGNNITEGAQLGPRSAQTPGRRLARRMYSAFHIISWIVIIVFPTPFIGQPIFGTSFL